MKFVINLVIAAMLLAPLSVALALGSSGYTPSAGTPAASTPAAEPAAATPVAEPAAAAPAVAQADEIPPPPPPAPPVPVEGGSVAPGSDGSTVAPGIEGSTVAPGVEGGSLSGAGGGTSLINPLGSDSIEAFFIKLIQIIIIFMVPIIIVFIMFAGYKYVTAQGNVEKIETATRALTWALVGGVLILGAEILLQIIKNTVAAIRQ